VSDRLGGACLFSGVGAPETKAARQATVPVMISDPFMFSLNDLKRLICERFVRAIALIIVGRSKDYIYRQILGKIGTRLLLSKQISL
jgi:MinD superfamily P-loop ATPase